MKHSKHTHLTIWIAIVMAVCTLCSCINDDEFTTSASAGIEFEMDTVCFDTVFTTIGSSTKRFKVFNRGDKGVRMTSVLLESGGSSGFRINVDGVTGAIISDIEIPRKDSIFVFAEVTVNPQDSDSPQLIHDAIIFNFESGRQQRLILEAWGQDVIVLKAEDIVADLTLNSPRPYLVYDSLVVKEGATLTLTAGTTLCFHNEASLIVHGTLLAEGTQEERVTLRGDRTDRMFSNLPYDLLDAQWGGVTIASESSGNILTYTDIHGGNYGIVCPQSTTDNQKLTLTSCIIHNVAGHGLALNSCKVVVENTQITNAGGDCVHLTGGDYSFTHCTIAQLYPWSSDRGFALYFSNTDDNADNESDSDTDQSRPLTAAVFRNCILTGWEWEDTMIEGHRCDDETVPFEYTFYNSLICINIKGKENEDFTSRCIDCINECGMEGEDVMRGSQNFIESPTYVYRFQLVEKSNARSIGDASFSADLPLDLDGNERPANHPDAGCYQFHN